ncbi:hypothetical protein ASC94_11285 [Massilia sp. Root418]|uniref:hypothetical protein n=1 Tax=Massilia sp. Root418 TaxID=1736532 RepID=UPI0006F2B8C0|nr:hypothetical protein [Massilia sp. Root418]KQW93241.1 hypothetical protein ASC94_11285 [Massilia sp. Root418]
MPIYVQHEVLGRIPDVFNAEAIWQAPGLALFSRRPLLRDLLERCPREHRGRAATRCFSHVTLMLPQEEVDDDYHLTRGNRARELAQTLTALHQKDFGDLLGSDQVRYDVLGKEELAPGEVEVRFGHAVYLPAPGEKALFNVSVSRDSAVWKPVCPVYPNQRLALIGGSESAASYVASGWPFGEDGAVLLLNDGPDAQPVVQMRPKDAFDCSFDASQGHYVIKSKRGTVDGLGAPARLLLKITRSSSAPPLAPRPAADAQSTAGAAHDGWNAAARPGSRPASGSGQGSSTGTGTCTGVGTGAGAGAQASPRPAVWQARAPMQADADLTAIPQPNRHPAARSGETDATYAPIVQRQRASLVALALPRLSRYRDTGASTLEVPFSRALGLNADPAAGTAISFLVNDSDELYACTENGRQRVTAPASFTPVDTRAIRLLPAPPAMAERYCATLCLARPVSTAIAAGARFQFGRSSAALSALRVLDSPRFLNHGQGEEKGSSSADRIGLSRNAFSFEAAPQGFRIGRLSASQALYHLDERLEFVASIGEASADAPYLLPAGHHLVAGHYVLRFDA